MYAIVRLLGAEAKVWHEFRGFRRRLNGCLERFSLGSTNSGITSLAIGRFLFAR